MTMKRWSGLLVIVLVVAACDRRPPTAPDSPGPPPAAPVRLQISGVVAEVGGTPIEGARINISWPVTGSAVTDAGGSSVTHDRTG